MISEEFRRELTVRCSRVYQVDDWSMRCPGCYQNPEGDQCKQLECARAKGVARCLDCAEYPCSISPIVSGRIEAKSILGDDVTRAILPCVHDRYGN